MISPQHQQRYRDYYAGKPILTRPNRWLPAIDAIADKVGAKTILDFGCGTARGVSKFSKYFVTDYDPGVLECSMPPPPADLVVSIHALEHIEPESLDATLAYMISLTQKALLIVVSCEPSTKVLPDGTPWHSLVHPYEWWARKMDIFSPLPVVLGYDKEYAGLYQVAR